MASLHEQGGHSRDSANRCSVASDMTGQAMPVERPENAGYIPVRGRIEVHNPVAQITEMLSGHAVADPYSHFACLREAAPLYRDERLGAWLVLRYDDVRAAFRDSRLSADRVSPYFERRRAHGAVERERATFDVLTRWIVFTDPPRHTRLRKLVDYAFRPRAVERMRGWIASLVDDLVDELGTEREFDFIERFASPLPVRVICDLFGVPHERRSELTRWSEDILTLVFGGMHSVDRHERAERSLRGFSEFLRGVIAERRVRPGEDLISDLVAAEERGDVLEEEEIVATCVLLLFAGHETTRNLLASGLKAILEHGSARAALASDPSRMPDAVEEILRFDGPTKAMWRQVVEPVKYGGQRIEPGERVLLVQASANRDPRRFEDAETFDIARTSNRHVGFGYSIHYCLGAAIARLEGALGLGAFLERFPHASLAADTFEWDPLILSRSLKRLPVRLG